MHGRGLTAADLETIAEAIGHRAVSRQWNKEMSDEEFNDFWRGIYEGHESSRQRYWKRIKARTADSRP